MKNNYLHGMSSLHLHGCRPVRNFITLHIDQFVKNLCQLFSWQWLHSRRDSMATIVLLQSQLSKYHLLGRNSNGYSRLDSMATIYIEQCMLLTTSQNF